MRVLHVSLCMGALFASGCASFSTHLVPRPTEPGRIEFAAHIDTLAYSDDKVGRETLPNIEASLRYGITQLVDVGAKVGPFSGELSSRVALLIDDTLDLSLVPSAGFTVVSVASGHEMAYIATFGLPVLAGVHVSDSLTLLLGAKVHAHIGQRAVKMVVGTETERELIGTEAVLFPGGVVGLQLEINENFQLFPEVNFLFPYVFENEKFARPVWQGGVAFQFRVSS